MTVAFDAFAASSTATSSFTFTHTPVGTPAGILVFVCGGASGTDDVTAVSYGGVAMTEVALSPNLKTTGEVGQVHGFFLGSGIPTGAQTVSVTCSGSAKRGYSISITASADTEVVTTDNTINSDSTTNPTCTLSLGGRTCFCAEGVWCGATSNSARTGWTLKQSFTTSAGSIGCHTYDTIGSSDVTGGFNVTSDDALCLAVAVSEVSGATGQPTMSRFALTQFNNPYEIGRDGGKIA